MAKKKSCVTENVEAVENANKSKGFSKTRKYQITINNPTKHGLEYEDIYMRCVEMEPEYFCMSEEIGNEKHTHHVHIFIKFENPRSFGPIKKIFPMAHLEACKFSDQANIDYVFKQNGAEEEHGQETNIKASHREWGQISEKIKKETASTAVKKLVDEGLTAKEIIDIYPKNVYRVKQIQSYMDVRKKSLYKRFEYENRDVKVIYIFGDSGAGKSHYVHEKHKYNICVANDYKQPFETYDYQDVMAFEEFRSDIPYKQMLQYLDIYPCSLPHRYENKQACYTTAYVISNIRLEDQYKDIDRNDQSWIAFLRRFSVIMEFIKTNIPDKPIIKVYNGYEDYKQNKFQSLEEFESEKHEQIKLV